MPFEYIPLLQLQRDLCEQRPGPARFAEYIRTMRGGSTDDMELPLSAFNPMAKDHVPALLDSYLRLDADKVARSAVQAAVADSQTDQLHFKVALVLADDARGGWTNRYSTELEHRFGGQAYHKRRWTTGMLWTSEPADIVNVRREAAAAVYRARYVNQHGLAKTVGQMMSQAGYVAANAGSAAPDYSAEEIDYTRTVIEPFLNSEIQSEQIACLFGDEAARELGHKPLGLSPRAGFALAFHDAS